jgi:hypothetical protein
MVYGESSFLVGKPTDYWGYLDLEFLRHHHVVLACLTLMLAICFLFGIGRNITCILLFISIELLQRMNELPLNGGDNFLKYILLYLSFCNCYKYYCINNSDYTYSIVNFMTNIGVYSIIIHLCIIYFISGISKLHSEVWYNGTAIYYILKNDRFMGTSINDNIISNGYWVTVITYTTMLWEVLFPFTVFNKQFKTTILTIGVGLHLGIYVFMMIHDFQWLFIGCYGLFFSDEQIGRIKRQINKLITKPKNVQFS